MYEYKVAGQCVRLVVFVDVGSFVTAEQHAESLLLRNVTFVLHERAEKKTITNKTGLVSGHLPLTGNRE